VTRVYTSPSLTGVRAAALVGLAITPLPASALIAGLRILGVEEGLPPLPDLEFAIYEEARPDKAASGARHSSFGTCARSIAPDHLRQTDIQTEQSRLWLRKPTPPNRFESLKARRGKIGRVAAICNVRSTSIRDIRSLTTNVPCCGTVRSDRHSTNVRYSRSIIQSRRSASCH
jgi:hypothetical protein